ncbi:MAG TPA: bifunctional protein-serine/threonine kinase/phosphatase [Egibacteraceae bacterium]|nr:bifunctional protein-serine/threonine kinase/phosphatase [Egibacteraceae bacterium]
MALDVEIGWFSARGPREHNEDFVAALRPAAHEAARGLVAAIADGVSQGGGGREAAQTTVMTLLQDYFATPDTWDTSVALDRVIGAQNAWLAGRNRRNPGQAAMTTLTAIVLRGHSYTLAHVGDSRAWLLRDGRCEPLTHDHVFDHSDVRSRVTRAIGLDEHVHPDYSSGELRPGDVFVLTTDGVHGTLRGSAIAAHVGGDDAQAASEGIVRAAVAAGSRDNASALVIRVRELDGADLRDGLLLARSLPALPRLRVGDELDGFVITGLLRDTGVHRLYQAREAASGRLVVLKAMHEARANDPEERAMLAHEAWLGQRLADVPGFVAAREHAGASALYAVFEWHPGTTLQQMLDRGRAFGVAQVVEGAVAVAGALGRLHRLGVVHRDIKPANLHLGDDGVWRILDLGAAISGRESPEQRALHAGTPSYMNPEQWEEGAGATPQSDLFALGVTLYQWLTGHLPYGEVEPYQRARYRRDPKAPSRLRPDVPIWLDHIVLKAVALDARQRFETAEELLLALERGASRTLHAPHATPLIARDPATLWKVALAVSAALNLLLVFWLLFLPR